MSSYKVRKKDSFFLSKKKLFLRGHTCAGKAEGYSSDECCSTSRLPEEQGFAVSRRSSHDTRCELWHGMVLKTNCLGWEKEKQSTLRAASLPRSRASGGPWRCTVCGGGSGCGATGAGTCQARRGARKPRRSTGWLPPLGKGGLAGLAAGHQVRRRGQPQPSRRWVLSPVPLPSTGRRWVPRR